MLPLIPPPPTKLEAESVYFPFSLRCRWGELLVYSFILLASLTFFLIQLTTWVLPQLALVHEFNRTKGVVKETRVATQTIDGNPVYRPEVRIVYSVKEEDYDTWAFDFKTLEERNGFVAQRATAESAIQPFTNGLTVDCWYSIEHPDRVVVSWKVPLWGWSFLFLSLCLVVVGLIGLISSLRQDVVSDEHKAVREAKPLFASTSPRLLSQQTIPDNRLIAESPGTHLAIRLPIETQPFIPLIGLMLFAIAWNLVAGGVMLHSWLNPLDNWSDHVFGSVLRGIFLCVGLVLLASAFHRILLTFGIGPTLLEISDHPIYPGRRYRMLLMQSGVLRFRELTVDVVCEEIARFHQGTDTMTSRKEVFRQSLFSRADFETTPGVPLEQEFFLQLPLGVMHSFRQENNEIRWRIDASAQVVGWPNTCRDYPIIVQPHDIGSATSEGNATLVFE